MKPGGFKPIQALMRENDAIAPILDRLKRVSRLQQIYAEAIPVGVAAMSRIAAAEGTTLTIAVANGAVATRLKQLVPHLLAKYQEKQDVQVTAIRILVQPDGDPYGPAEPARRAPQPRQEIPLQVLDSLSETLDDSPLKTTLQRIQKKRKRGLTP